MNPTESLTLRELIRARPLAVGILEREAGFVFWNRLDATLADFCRDNRIDAARITKMLSDLPPEGENKDWNEKPLYHLVDFLTANHREFRNRYMPNITRLLESLKNEFPTNPEPIAGIIAEFNEFRKDFSWHMQDEEEFVYPKILRTEACVHHPELYPEIFKGSVSMYPKSSLRSHEAAFFEIIQDLTRKLKGMVFEVHQLPMVKDILSALVHHDEGLKAHAFLETEVLFPRASEMEGTLLQRAQSEEAQP